MGRFDELLQKELTRKEFVSKLGLALLALVGLPGIVGLFSKNVSTKQDSTNGFGSGTYR